MCSSAAKRGGVVCVACAMRGGLSLFTLRIKEEKFLRTDALLFSNGA